MHGPVIDAHQTIQQKIYKSLVEQMTTYFDTIREPESVLLEVIINRTDMTKEGDTLTHTITDFLYYYDKCTSTDVHIPLM